MDSSKLRRPLARRTVAAAVILLASAFAAIADAAPAQARPTAGACAVPETANGRYVVFVYDAILRRCPDASGLRYWEGRLDAGLSRWSFAEALDTSTENLGRNNVDGMYRGLLGRAPTPGERSYWINHLRQAHANAVPIAALIASDEGYRLHTAAIDPVERDREWLAFAYNRILDRAPDPAGEAHYLRQFSAAGSTRAQRSAVAMSLEHSAANARSWVLATMTGALDRTPDPAGIRYWTTWLTGPGRWQTFRLWTRLLASDEAYRRAQRAP